MVWSAVKAVPVLTVTVEVPAASAMEAGSTAIDSAGALNGVAVASLEAPPLPLMFTASTWKV